MTSFEKMSSLAKNKPILHIAQSQLKTSLRKNNDINKKVVTFNIQDTMTGKFAGFIFLKLL